MAIYQYVSLGFPVYGDGVSTVQTIDFAKQIETAFENTPIGDMVVIQTPTLAGGITSTAVVSGTRITFTWSSAPTAGQAGATVIVGF